MSITHGSPRQHVWTLAATHDEFHEPLRLSEYSACPCVHPNHSFTGVISTFVGNDYYCESGAINQMQPRFYSDISSLGR